MPCNAESWDEWEVVRRAWRDLVRRWRLEDRELSRLLPDWGWGQALPPPDRSAGCAS